MRLAQLSLKLPPHTYVYPPQLGNNDPVIEHWKISRKVSILICIHIGTNSEKIFKVACRVQIWKKTFCQNSNYLGYRFIKNDIMFMYLFCFYKIIIILSQFQFDTLTFTMYILTILTCPLKTYVVRLHNLISMNIFFTIDHKRS